MKIFYLLLILATSSYAQYGGNKTFYAIISTAKEGVTAANRLATVFNDSIPIVADKLKAIEDRMKSIEDSLNSISSASYIIGVASAVVTISALIAGVFIGTRHLINRHNIFGAAEPYESPRTPAPVSQVAL
jgi:hypothetical protein